MRKTNPIFAGVAAVALAATMVPAFALAADINSTSATSTTGVTQVKYYVSEGYTWSVPAEIDFGKDEGVNKTSVVNADADSGATQKVKVTKNVIAEGKQLKITAEGSGTDRKFTIKNGDSGTAVLGYTVKAGESEITPKGVVLTVDSGTYTGAQSLTFTLSTATGDNAAEVAGSYSGTVTYTASVVDKTLN